MQVAFLFPGQGSQYVGMGQQLFTQEPLVRQVFEKANDLLGFNLKKLCLEGPQEELTSTQNSQPAILTMNYALWSLLKQRYPDLECCATAGLSLGEYSALVAAQALNFEQALPLVRRRGELMAEVGREQGGSMMSIIGLERSVVRDLCQDVQAQLQQCCQPANLNCPGQIVISGHEAALSLASDLAQDKGARKCIKLDVSGAFHSQLMRPAAERFDQAVKNCDWKDPQCLFYSNVSAAQETCVDQIQTLLVQQLFSPVLWQDSLQKMIQQDQPDLFLELGPGQVLTGLLKRIDRQQRCYSSDNPDRWQQLCLELDTLLIKHT